MRTNTSLIIFCSFLICSWLQPLHLLPWVSLHSEVLAFIAILASIAYKFSTEKKQDRIQIPRLAVWILFFFVVLIIQYAFGKIHYFGDLVIYSLYLFVAVFALVFGSNYGRSEELVKMMSFAVLIGGSVTVLVLLIQAFGLDIDSQYVNPMPKLRRPGGNMGQPNHAGTLVVMAIVSTCYLGINRNLSASLAAVFLIILALGVGITESRTAFLSVWLLCIFGIAKVWFDKRWFAMMYVVLFVCIHQLLWWSWPPLFLWYWGLYSEGAAELNRLTNMGGNLRLVMWQQVLEAVNQKPWMGWGWGQLSKALNNTVDGYTVSAPFTYSHNIVLDIAIAFGIPTAVLFCSGIAFFVLRCIRNSNVLSAFWGLCLILPIGIHSLLEFPYAYAYFLIPACVLLGSVQRDLGITVSFPIRPKVLGAVICCVTVLGMQITREYLSLEDDFRVARFESMRIGSLPSGHAPPQTVVLTQLRDMVRAARTKPSPMMAEESILELQEVAQRFPNTGLQNRYALALALNNRADESLRQLRVIRVMYGEQTYIALENYWRELATAEYPQLDGVIAKAF